MKKDQIMSVVLAIMLVASLLFGALRENWTQEQKEPGGYSMTVERSGIDGDASFSITLYEPGGGAVLRRGIWRGEICAYPDVCINGSGVYSPCVGGEGRL